MFNQP
ncbi:hypothetical protein YPPY94_4653, partial [Yersinia pestis PY-94]|jgi:hypothetical protein